MMRLTCLFLTILLACSTKKNTQPETTSDQPEVKVPTFSSQKFEASFPSQLSKEMLEKAASYTDNQIGIVKLIKLLPDCQTFDGEERCYETTVLSSIEGDSLKSEHLTNPDSILIDSDHLGETKTLAQEDIKKLLPALFTGDQKESYSFCYNPRHAIAIYNSEGSMSGFIEICFECFNTISVLNGFELPELSQNALNGIGELFIAYGYEEETPPR